MVEDEKMMDMFNDLMVQGYRVFKSCSVVPNPETVGFTSTSISAEPDVAVGLKLYKATIRIPTLGEFTIHSRDNMRVAIRGAALKLKYYLKDEGIGDYDLRPTATTGYRGNQFPSPFFTGVPESKYCIVFP